MSEDAAAASPPPLALKMRQAIDAASVRLRDRISVHHEDDDGQGPYGWESTLRRAGHPEVQACSWYDGGDQDVMLLGDAPYRGWSLVADGSEWVAEGESFMVDEHDVQLCLREVHEVIDDLAGPGWDRAVARAAVRQRLDARPRWATAAVPPGRPALALTVGELAATALWGADGRLLIAHVRVIVTLDVHPDIGTTAKSPRPGPRTGHSYRPACVRAPDGGDP